MFGLAVPKKLLPSSLFPLHRHRHHHRRHHPTPKSTTSAFHRGGRLSPVISTSHLSHAHSDRLNAGSESSDVESEYSLVSTTGTATQESVTHAFFDTVSFILLDVNFQVIQTFRSIRTTTRATVQEVVAVFYALRRVVVVLVQIALSVFGVGLSLAEEGVRGAVEEGERVGREEWEREQFEKEQAEMSRNIRRERRASNGSRSTLKSAHTPVKSGAGLVVLHESAQNSLLR